MRKRGVNEIKKIAIASAVILISGFLIYALFGQEYLYAKSFAAELYEYPLPDKTKVTEKDFDYGLLFGGGPSGSGGYPTVASYIEIESELSEKELYDYYNKDNVFSTPGKDTKRIGFELYFAGHYDKQIEKLDPHFLLIIRRLHRYFHSMQLCDVKQINHFKTIRKGNCITVPKFMKAYTFMSLL